MNNLEKLKNYKILYCEDNSDLMLTFRLLLKNKTDNIIFAENGKIGLDMYHNDKPDIIITDINMPEKSGMELAEEIRIIDEEIPIIIATSYDDQKYFLNAIDLGVDKFLIKPLKKESLLATLDNIVTNLFNKQEAQKYHAKKELEKIRENTKDVISKFSGIFIEPILIYQGSHVKFINEALEKIIGVENTTNILNGSRKIDDFFEKKESFCNSIDDFSIENSYKNRVSLVTNKRRRIFQVIVRDLYFEGEDFRNKIYVFQDITMVEYQKIKLKSYSSSLEDLLIKSKYKKDINIIPEIELPDTEKKREMNDEEGMLLRKSHIEKMGAEDFLSITDASVYEDLDELKEVEEEIELLLYDFSSTPQKSLLDNIISKLSQYARAIKNLQEFDELAQALFSTENVLNEISVLDEDNSIIIKMFLENIFQDLAKWRDTIFVKKDTEDIHYLDSSLFSSCLQLELSLTGVKAEEDDEDDFELF